MGYKQRSATDTLNLSVQQDGMLSAKKQVWLADWKKFGLPYCSVYIISPDNHWPCKIGISVNPRVRVCQIQTSCWRPLKVDLSVYCASTVEAKKLESAIHSELCADGKQLSGEWFDIRATEARDLLMFKVDVLGIDAKDELPEGKVLEDVELATTHYLGTGNALRVYGSSRGIDN
jgi:hypothetical protein